MEEDKLHRMAYDAYMKTLFFTEHQKSYIQGFKDGYNSRQLEPLVVQKTGGNNPSQKVWDDNIQHTLWKFQSFLKTALPSHLRLEWEHATGIMEAPKKKFDQLQREVFIRPKRESRIKLFIKKVRASFSA